MEKSPARPAPATRSPVGRRSTRRRRASWGGDQARRRPHNHRAADRRQRLTRSGQQKGSRPFCGVRCQRFNLLENKTPFRSVMNVKVPQVRVRRTCVGEKPAHVEAVFVPDPCHRHRIREQDAVAGDTGEPQRSYITPGFARAGARRPTAHLSVLSAFQAASFFRQLRLAHQPSPSMPGTRSPGGAPGSSSG